MFECDDVTDAMESTPTDPRLTGAALRCIPRNDGAGTVLLVGVVHDHPASTFRVANILDTVDPDVLALELPPLAMPIFQLYAQDEYTPPSLGGEMSMALQAAGDIESVGIDGPNRTYLRMLIENVADRRVPGRVIATVLKDIGTSSAHALWCRLGALLGAITPLRVRVYSQIPYECTLLDSPSVQAAHETEHLSKQQAFLQAIQVPHAVELIDRTREASMVTTLHDLRLDGDVVAVIGMEHLDTIEAQLSDPP